MSRVMRGTAALVALLAGLVGVPAALVVLGGVSLPGALSWTSIRSALLTPDDGTLLIGLVTIVGWVAWLIFAVSVLTEVVSLVSGRRIRLRLPGFGGPQRLAAGLLISVLTMLSLPQATHDPGPAQPSMTARPSPSPSAPEVVTRPTTSAPRAGVGDAVSPALPSLAAPSGHRSVTQAVTHEVKPGDDLWSLAEHYYGQGRGWRKIAAANPHVLTGGPDRLQPGWRLTIPGVARPDQGASSRFVSVRRGDTLSSVAERELGSTGQWKEIYQLNRGRLDDPDELAVGMRLELPSAHSGATRDVAEDADSGPDRLRPPATSHAEPRAQTQDKSPVQPRSEAGDSADPPPAPTPAPTSAPTGPPPGSVNPEGHAPSASAEPSARDADPPLGGSGEARASEAPVSEAPTQQGVPTQHAVPAVPAVPTRGWMDAGDPALPLAGVGGLLAAGLIGGLAVRRRTQLQMRPVGRRIAQPPPPVRAVEVALGHRQRPLSLRTLDRATRAVAAHCRNTGGALPPLLFAAVADQEIELVFSQPWPDPPVGFTARGRSWLLSQADASYLSSMPGLSDSGRPWPALVTLGQDDRGRQIVADLEAMGLMQLRSDQPREIEAVLAAMAVELSFSPWADEMVLTLVGSCPGLPAALGKHNVTRTDDLDALLERLAQRAQIQRAQQPRTVLGQHRIDPDLADPWAAEIVLINAVLSAGQQAKLAAVVAEAPRVTIAAVVSDPSISAPWSLGLPDQPPGSKDQPRGWAMLEPAQIRLQPQRLDPPTMDTVIELVQTTGSEATTPAPWWAESAVRPDPPPDNVTFLGKRGAGWDTAEAEGEEAIMAGGAVGAEHPLLQLLGPVELLGAAGDPPPRAGKQCLEYCGWLLEHPRTTAQAMAAALVVAEGTRRSNMSRLRGWLGANAEGEAYLPDAYTGRIVLHPAVSSDWQQLKILVGPGVNRAGTDSLRAALGLVRGAPLADAAPGQWHWAEELRTDMISCLRDIGVELATRALEQGDIDGARWAAGRALVAAPGDELLMAARIRTEHLAGNAADTERLTLQLAAQARSLGVDLDSGTVLLLQQVMEGRVRARMA